MAVDYRERQEDELQVLQAVYMDDVQDLRTHDAWKVYQAPKLRLKLVPQQSQTVDVKSETEVCMVVKCPAAYPEELPSIALENSKGLSTKEMIELKDQLDSLAQTLKGEVMLLELAQHVQQYLHSHIKPPAKSFYEEMISNRQRQEEKQAEEHRKKLELLRKKEEKERQLLEDEIQRRQEALKIETKKKKEEYRQIQDLPSSEPTTPSSSEAITYSPIGTPGTPKRAPRRSVSPSPIIILKNNVPQAAEIRTKRQRRTSTPHGDCNGEGDNPCKNHTGGIVVLAFNTKAERTIHRGICLGHGASGSTVYAGIDTSTGELVAITEWILKWQNVSKKAKVPKGEEDKEAANIMKQVMSIEQELLSLIKLHHDNLVHYLAMKYQREAGKIIIYLLMEYAGGQSLEIHIKRKQPVALDVVKAYAEEILLALEYIHSKDVAHKNLRPSSVFVDNTGRIRLSDYSLDKRLSDLYHTVEASRPGVHFSPDQRVPVPGSGRVGKKSDVYQMGLLLLSIAQGFIIKDSVPDIPTMFPTEFQDFLTKCLLNDDRHRWAVHQLLEHPFIKSSVALTAHYIHAKPVEQQHMENKEKEKIDKDSGDESEEEIDQPFITAFEASGQSRLTSEFEVLKSLGKGGFGDVIKVKNKLDARMYAIKRIPLNPRSKQFNKKITREVKLLSRLNHENVVRYYNSWIETSEDPAESESSSSCSSSNRAQESQIKNTQPSKKVKAVAGDQTSLFRNTLGFTDDIEKYAPPAVDGSVDWSISYDVPGGQVSDSDDDDDEEDVADVFGTSFLMKSDSAEDVVFEHSVDDMNLFEQTKSQFDFTSSSSLKKSSDLDKKEETTDEESVIVPKLQYLYIQMEYCEKSTLRNCIDAGLYQDIDRVWRLFREIAEGLLHIHQQGMIHRDLKPVNIFLDSNDHVKIGDFGLATSSIIGKQSTTMYDVSLCTSSTGDIHSSRSGSIGDGNMTGKVGTALYVSPEMMTGENKIVYSQKVDIYSLGIIFFEMCYKPLPTGMERVKILGNLRLKEIKFPDDFDQVDLENQTKILTLLLNHDPSQRPTSKELLQSEYLPPPQMEEAELNEVLRSTISNPNSKAYRRMVNTLFSQTINSADDVMYDTDYHKSAFSLKSLLIQQVVRETLNRLFKKHGAVQLTTPLLMPKCDLYAENDPYTCVMDHSGQPVGLPFDLRVPFARYLARSNIPYLKRYCIGRVYREKKIFVQHPRELIECAFDIVTPTPGSLIPDAELMVLVQDIINEFSSLQNRNYYVRINHISVLQAVLIHTGVPEDKYEAVLRVLTGTKIESQNKSHIKALNNLKLTETTVNALLSILEMEGTYKRISSYLRCITKTKGPASTLAKQGLHEVDAVIGHAEAMGLKLPVVFTLGCIYNTQQYSGVIFQVVFDTKKKKGTTPDPIAAGGRYDSLIQKFRCPLPTNTVNCQSAVGVSIAFEKIVMATIECREFHPPSPYDILVCTISHNAMLKERMNVVRDLWLAGLRTDILLETLQDLEYIQEYCRSMAITYLVILKDSDSGFVKVKTIEKERITEKKVNVSDLVEYLQPKTDQNELLTNVSNKIMTTTVQPHAEGNQSSSSGNMSINFTFLLPDGNRIAGNTRRKYESQIFGKVCSTLSWVQTKYIEVIYVELNSSVLKCIAAYLEIDESEKEFEASIGTILEKHQRHRKYLSKIIDHIYQLKFEKKCKFVVLYGSKDDSLRLLV